MDRLSLDMIKKMHEVPNAPTQSETPVSAPKAEAKPEFRSAVQVRTNKYAGRCVLCSTWVEAEEGLLSKDNGSWVVTHRNGQCGVPEAKTEVKPQDFVSRPNKFAGRCTTCQTKVGEMEGILSKADDGKWEVEHKPGECPANEFPFPLGRYAVDTEEGHLAFYVATLDGLFVQASDDLHRVAVNAQDGIIAKIAADPEAASKRYGQELGQCGRCGKTLTSEWRHEGIGPVCVTKGWAV